MNIPNIPSDNLYKFVALASLVTLILSTYFLASLKYEILSELTNHNGELKQILSLGKEEIDNWEELIKQQSLLENQLVKIIEEFNKSHNQAYMDNRSQKIEDMEINIKETNSMIHAISIKRERLQIEADTKESLVENKKILLNYVETTRSYSVIILSIFMIFGFLFWYVKVQRYQDKILKYQANSINMKEK